MPLQMHRQQDVLHDILGLVDRLPGTRKAATRRCPQYRRDGFEQPAVSGSIARNRRPHQAGPFVVTFAHTRSQPSNSFGFSYYYKGSRQITKT